jgi:hypothetical protein
MNRIEEKLLAGASLVFHPQEAFKFESHCSTLAAFGGDAHPRSLEVADYPAEFSGTERYLWSATVISRRDHAGND